MTEYLLDKIREKLDTPYWQLSRETSGVAAAGIDVIRALLDYADKVDNEAADGWVYADGIRVRIARALDIDVDNIDILDVTDAAEGDHR